MNRFIALSAVLALVGCDELPIGKDDSGTPYYTTKTDVVMINSGTIDCLDANTVEMTMNTSGPVASAEIYSQETANSSTGGQWAENTNLVSLGNGDWEQTLTNVATPPDVVQDSTTLFKCNGENHHDTGVMTYVFRAYDATDTLYDCVVAGDDASGLVAGEYWDDVSSVAGGPTMQGDINSANCRIEAFSY